MSTQLEIPVPQGGTTVPTTSAMAVIAMVFGVLSWVVLPFVGAIVAVVTGHLARSEIKRAQGTVDGDGLAIAGLVLGWTQLILSIAATILVLMFGFGALLLIAAAGLNQIV